MKIKALKNIFENMWQKKPQNLELVHQHSKESHFPARKFFHIKYLFIASLGVASHAGFLSLSRSASVYIHRSESLIWSTGRLSLPVYDKPLPLNTTSVITVSTQHHIFLLFQHYCSYCYTGMSAQLSWHTTARAISPRATYWERTANTQV